MLITLEVSKLAKSKLVRLVQRENIPYMYFT